MEELKNTASFIHVSRGVSVDRRGVIAEEK